MKKSAFPLLALLFCTPIFAEQINIEINQFPSKALDFIEEYFSNDTISKAYVEKRASLVQYEVKMTNGNKLQFTRNGNWSEIKCQSYPLPSGILPEKIEKYIEATTSGLYITEAEHNGRLYEISLNNGIELTFNNSFRLIDIDN